MAREVFNAFEGCVEEMANQRPSLQDMDIEVFPANSPKAKSLIEISVAASGEQHTAAESQSVVEKCFDSMHLLNCYSSKHFKAALEIVDGLLLKHSDCSMVAIDGLDAFYWLDTYECRIRMQTHYARNVERLRKLCDRHGVCCAYTVNATYLSAKKLKDLDDNMLGRKSLQKSVKVEHKLQLQLANNGERTLNGMSVEIRQHSLFVVKQ
uniref:DNA repair protein XRCC2 n=1 Tax=Zeugodacus cucurbitae TaxID=28588 RepID=A0A0A1XMZ9_ZEUCU